MSEAMAAGETRTRAAGLMLVATGLATFGLLSMHPAGNAHEFADILKEEADNRLMDAVVHGGNVVVLAFQLVGYAIFSRRLGMNRPSVLGGLVFFAIGAAFFIASMVLDGIVTPAVAARYLPKPEKIDFARSLFVYTGILISTLMPAAMFFQSLGIAAWGFALTTKPQPSRAAGILGLTIGGVLAAAITLTVAAFDPMVLMGGIVLLAVWALAAGFLLATSTTDWRS